MTQQQYSYRLGLSAIATGMANVQMVLDTYYQVLAGMLLKDELDREQISGMFNTVKLYSGFLSRYAEAAERLKENITEEDFCTHITDITRDIAGEMSENVVRVVESMEQPKVKQ